jgi:hypothetical protein
MENCCVLCDYDQELNTVCSKHKSNLCNTCLQSMMRINILYYNKRNEHKDPIFPTCVACMTNSCVLSICGHKCHNSIRIKNNKNPIGYIPTQT